MTVESQNNSDTDTLRAIKVVKKKRRRSTKKKINKAESGQKRLRKKTSNKRDKALRFPDDAKSFVHLPDDEDKVLEETNKGNDHQNDSDENDSQGSQHRFPLNVIEFSTEEEDIPQGQRKQTSWDLEQTETKTIKQQDRNAPSKRRSSQKYHQDPSSSRSDTHQGHAVGRRRASHPSDKGLRPSLDKLQSKHASSISSTGGPTKSLLLHHHHRSSPTVLSKNRPGATSTATVSTTSFLDEQQRQQQIRKLLPPPLASSLGPSSRSLARKRALELLLKQPLEPDMMAPTRTRIGTRPPTTIQQPRFERKEDDNKSNILTMAKNINQRATDMDSKSGFTFAPTRSHSAPSSTLYSSSLPKQRQILPGDQHTDKSTKSKSEPILSTTTRKNLGGHHYRFVDTQQFDSQVISPLSPLSPISPEGDEEKEEIRPGFFSEDVENPTSAATNDMIKEEESQTSVMATTNVPEEQDEENDNEQESERENKRQWVMTIVIVALVVCLTVNLSVLTIQGAFGPTRTKILTPTEFADLIASLSLDNGLASQQANSPQSKALAWINTADGGLARFQDTTRLVQRYSLATLYFASLGNEDEDASWDNRDGWLTSQNECLWWHSSNKATSIDNISPCTRSNIFTSLQLSLNNLRGTLPPEVSLLSNLRHIDLSYNGLRLNLPSSLGNLSLLESLVLSNNQFNGPFPTVVSRMENLRYLFLDANNFDGSLPSLTGLTNLEMLSLSANFFSSSLPESIDSLTNLRSLNVGHNSLTGTISSKIGKLRFLEHLELDANEWEDGVLERIATLFTLRSISCFGCGLNGTISAELGSLTLLENLGLGKNSLNGTIPSELGLLKNVINLDLSSNELTGLIPTQLGCLQGLAGLDVSDNEMEGALPSELGALTSFPFNLQFENNNFNGSIPLELCSLVIANRGFIAVDDGEVQRC